jgi:hypothetical protein
MQCPSNASFAVTAVATSGTVRELFNLQYRGFFKRTPAANAMQGKFSLGEFEHVEKLKQI